LFFLFADFPGTKGPTSTDLLVDGFVARTFASEGATNYFELLFRNKHFIQHFGILYHQPYRQGAWYITHNVNSVQGNSPGVPLQTSPLLDYSTTPTYGTVVPQQRWTPADEADVRRHVEDAALELPIFFVNHNGSIGFPLVEILRGCDRDLHNANDFATLSGKTTTQIRINVSSSLGYYLVVGNHDLTYAKLLVVARL
jgi:hypothetical protein